jgi:hypothetical protein
MVSHQWPIEGGLNMGLLFQFLKRQRDLNLSASVAYLKEFFSTTTAPKVSLASITLEDMKQPR